MTGALPGLAPGEAVFRDHQGQAAVGDHLGVHRLGKIAGLGQLQLEGSPDNIGRTKYWPTYIVIAFVAHLQKLGG